MHFLHKWWNNEFEKMYSYAHNKILFRCQIIPKKIKQIFNIEQNIWLSCFNNQLCYLYSWLLPLIIFDNSLQDHYTHTHTHTHTAPLFLGNIFWFLWIWRICLLFFPSNRLLNFQWVLSYGVPMHAVCYLTPFWVYFIFTPRYLAGLTFWIWKL